MQAISESGQIAKAHQYVDSHLPEHVQRFREIVHIPSIAAENPEGVRECAKLVQGWFKELGCREATIVETGGSPVVYGHYDARAKNTLLVYFMYDVKQVSGEHWTLIRDPFKPELLTLQPFRKVMVGRGAYNSKGPMTAFLNSLFSIKQTGGRIPINLKFIAEGEEELGSQHLIDFVEEYADRLSDGTACFSPAPSQNIKGVPSIYLGCKGVVELELECSGQYWGRGPTVRGIHSSQAAIVESPVWRMITALASIVDPKIPAKF